MAAQVTGEEARFVSEDLPHTRPTSQQRGGDEAHNVFGELFQSGSKDKLMEQIGVKRSSISWSSIVSGRVPVREDQKLKFIPPVELNGTQVVVCLAEEVEVNLQAWHHSLVGSVFSKKPYFVKFRNFLNKMWKTQNPFEVLSRDNGVFLFRFGSESDCMKILEEGPWFFKGRLVALKRWGKDCLREKSLMDRVPIWIRFPNFPLEVWSSNLISRIASLIGTPLNVDKATSRQERLAFVRCCVEIGVDDIFSDDVLVTIEGKGARSFSQRVVYDWKPLKCSHYKSIGHLETYCLSLLDVGRKSRSVGLGKKEWRPVVAPSGSVKVVASISRRGGTQDAVASCIAEATFEVVGKRRQGIEKLGMQRSCVVSEGALHGAAVSSLAVLGGGG